MEHHWDKPDCTIFIPQRSPIPRVAHPNTAMTLHLHTQCLSAKSVLFRGLFSGLSPLDLIQTLCAFRLQPLRVPRSRLPRLLPSLPSHPVIFLPVPDPSSIQLLFHWMYFANTDHIKNALDQGDIQWEGLARNVEYLGLSTDIKVVLGRWYRNRFLPAQRASDSSPCPTNGDDESHSGSDYDDSDSDEYHSPCTQPTDDGVQGGDECDRGRTRDVKPLVQLCGRLRLRTTG